MGEAMTAYIIGLDFGTESARGVLLEAATGLAVASHVHPYRHGVMTMQLPNGRKLPRDWALQHAPDYIEAAEIVLAALGKGRDIRSIGLDFTASTPSNFRPERTRLPRAPLLSSQR